MNFGNRRNRQYASSKLLTLAGTILTLLLGVSQVSAETHKWVDAEGNTHYGDRPPASPKVQLKNISVESFSSVDVRAMNPDDLAALASERKPAGRKESVVMYSTENCGYCKKAKTYFGEKGIRYTERDIDKSKSARRQWEKLNGNGVPLIVVGNNKMSGFSAEHFEQLYSR